MMLKNSSIKRSRKSKLFLLSISLALSIVFSVPFCAEALEPGQQQYLLQDGVEYTLFCLGPSINQEMTTTTVWTSSFHNRIDYTTFFASPGGGYFYRLKVGVKSGSLFTIAPGQTVKVSTLVTDFESDTFENMQFELVYSVNGQSKMITKVFSGTVLETEAFFVINNDTSSDYQILSFAMYYKTSDGYPDPAYTGSNFGFRNPAVYMYDQSDKILGGVTSYFDQPVDPPDNQYELENTISEYHKQEEELMSNVDTSGIITAIGDLNLGGLIPAAGVFNELFDHLWNGLGKLQLVSQFAVVSGVVMMLLGLSVTVGNIMEVNRLGKLRQQERAARAEETVRWRNYLVGRHQQQDLERSQRMAKGKISSSIDIDAYENLGLNIPTFDDE